MGFSWLSVGWAARIALLSCLKQGTVNFDSEISANVCGGSENENDDKEEDAGKDGIRDLRDGKVHCWLGQLWRWLHVCWWR